MIDHQHCSSSHRLDQVEKSQIHGTTDWTIYSGSSETLHRRSRSTDQAERTEHVCAFSSPSMALLWQLLFSSEPTSPIDRGYACWSSKDVFLPVFNTDRSVPEFKIVREPIEGDAQFLIMDIQLPKVVKLADSWRGPIYMSSLRRNLRKH